MLGIEQQKGNPDVLDGRVTVYAVIDIEPSELMTMKHPIASAIHNGFLVAQGNFKDQNSLEDFLQSEMGLSLEEGLEEIIERLDGLESALDPQKLREKIQNMKEFGDFIPTPAKIVPFHSDEEIRAQEGDVYCAGSFKNIGNANLSVNAFPILYQACYREQQIEKVKSEIEQLIAQIEKGGAKAEGVHYASPGIDVREKILKEFIPNMLYCRKDAKVFDAAQNQFRSFMRGYEFQKDVDAVVATISGPEELTVKHFRLLELYAGKIAEMHAENFAKVEEISREIERQRHEG